MYSVKKQTFYFNYYNKKKDDISDNIALLTFSSS